MIIDLILYSSQGRVGEVLLTDIPKIGDVINANVISPVPVQDNPYRILRLQLDRVGVYSQTYYAFVEPIPKK